MSDFVVHTPEQLAAHDAATSKRYLEALRELQAENARLRAHIQKAADDALKAGLAAKSRTAKSAALMHHVWHLAALNHTEGKKKIDDAVDKAWGRFCAAMPDDQSPYPGMAKAFEVHYGVSWTDRDWRNEQSTWAAAWRMAWDRRATVLDAEQDAARLDFLDSIGAAYGFEDTHEGNRWMIDGPFNSLRAAIDAAIDAAIEKGGA